MNETSKTSEGIYKIKLKMKPLIQTDHRLRATYLIEIQDLNSHKSHQVVNKKHNLISIWMQDQLIILKT